MNATNINSKCNDCLFISGRFYLIDIDILLLMYSFSYIIMHDIFSLSNFKLQHSQWFRFSHIRSLLSASSSTDIYKFCSRTNCFFCRFL